jgi:predicted dehydrogenase
MKPLNRRAFLGAAASAAAVSPLRSLAAAGRSLKLGLIGCGGYGLADVKAALKVGGVEVVALCDVDSENLAKVAAEVEKLQGARPKACKLYEELLATPGLELAIIATPPHWHALQLIAAVRRGLDVYCEKPLSFEVREGRAMVDAVAQSGRIVQLGFQRRQSPAYQAVRQFINDGHLGRVVQAEAQIFYQAGTLSPVPQPPPAALDWDLWCGPGPLLPYSPQVGHRNWRLEQTSGQGHLYDWGIHLIDATRMILGEKAPRAVSAAGGNFHLRGKITTPDTLTVQFEFEQLPVVWRHRIWGAVEGDPEFSNGMFFYGDEATVFASDQRWIVLREGKDAKPEEFKVEADLGTLHMADFLACVRSRKQPTCSVEDGFRSTATVQLGMIAYETSSTVHWDDKTRQILKNPEAAKLLQREYRAPYVHPYRA